jgi:hypothetical protein
MLVGWFPIGENFRAGLLLQVLWGAICLSSVFLNPILAAPVCLASLYLDLVSAN